jgi:hypothetical protein
MRRSTYGLAALLFASLALNVALWTARRPSSLDRAGPAAAAASRRVDATPCEQRLRGCEQRSWDIVQRVIAADRAPKPASPAEAMPISPDRAAQEAALCTKAKESLRETWLHDRDNFASNLKRSLADAEEQERDAAKEAAKMAEVARLDDRAAAEVARGYRAKRLARVAQARAALEREPQDFAGLLDEARGLFADEDALLEQAGGPAAREAWRAEQLEGRTVILALVAATADLDWDESIRW